MYDTPPCYHLLAITLPLSPLTNSSQTYRPIFGLYLGVPFDNVTDFPEYFDSLISKLAPLISNQMRRLDWVVISVLGSAGNWGMASKIEEIILTVRKIEELSLTVHKNLAEQWVNFKQYVVFDSALLMPHGIASRLSQNHHPTTLTGHSLTLHVES